MKRSDMLGYWSRLEPLAVQAYILDQVCLGLYLALHRFTIKMLQAEIISTYPGSIPFDIGPCDSICDGCQVAHWPLETTSSTSSRIKKTFSTCCQGGEVVLPTANSNLLECPQFLQDFLCSDSPRWSSLMLSNYELP